MINHKDWKPADEVRTLRAIAYTHDGKTLGVIESSSKSMEYLRGLAEARFDAHHVDFEIVRKGI